MAAFSTNTHNPALNVGTGDFCQMTITVTTATDKPAGYVIARGGAWRIYISLMQWMKSLANCNPTLLIPYFRGH